MLQYMVDERILYAIHAYDTWYMTHTHTHTIYIYIYIYITIR